MDDGLKQRLIGAFVLLALAVIFLPAFFDRERMKPVDKKTQIPAAPHIEAIEIKDTVRTEVEVNAKAPDTMFVPQETGSPQAVTEGAQLANSTESLVEGNPTVTPKPQEDSASQEKVSESTTAITRDQHGVPEGWVLQVASFKEKERASVLLKKLDAKGYAAFTRTVSTQQGELTRLYVGPKLNKNELLKEKKRIEKEFKLSTLVLKFTP